MRLPNRSYLQPASPWIMAMILAIVALASEGCFKDPGQGQGSGAESVNPRANNEIPAEKNVRSERNTHSTQPGTGKTAVSSGQSGSEASKLAAPKVAPPKAECFSMSFKHRDLAAHRDGEACLNHDNVFKLPPKRINTKTLCVRVNGTPVRHRLVKGKPGLVTIGSVAGPESLVTVRWCTEKTTCKEDCTIPKDEFMDAIGGMADGGGAYVQWDPTDKKKGPSDDEIRLEKELKTFGGAKREFFDQWIAQAKPKLTCGTEVDRSVANR